MIRRTFMTISASLFTLLVWTCSLGVEPVSKPDFSGLIMLAPGDSSTLSLTQLMALENDQILTYEVTGLSDSSIAQVWNLSGDSLKVMGGQAGVCDLTLLASSGSSRYEVALKISVSSVHQSGSANSINLGDTLVVNLWDYGVVESTTIDSIHLNFSTPGICQQTGFENGLLSFSTIRPGETSAVIEVWQSGTRTMIELELDVFIQRMVLAELFTNAGCIPCAPANELLNAINSASPEEELAVIRYHVWWPSPNDPMFDYNLTENTARVYYYQIPQAPTLVIDGVFAPSSTGLWATQIQQASENDALIRIEISDVTDIGVDSIAIDFQMDSYAETELTNLRIMFAVTEDSVEFLGENGEDMHMQVMRDYHYMPLASLAPDGQFLGQGRLKWTAVSADRSRYQVIVFVQNDSDKKLLQATQISLN